MNCSSKLAMCWKDTNDTADFSIVLVFEMDFISAKTILLYLF